MKFSTPELRIRLQCLSVEMNRIAEIMSSSGNKKTKKHAKELYGASEICKEWSEKARCKK